MNQKPVELAKEEIKYVLSRGRYIRKTEGTYKYLRETGLKYRVIVSKKVGKAVTRNLMKRWFRNALKQELQSSSDVWIVLILYKQIANYTSVVSALAATLERIQEDNNGKIDSYMH